MKPRQKRFVYIVVALVAVGLAVALVLNALKDNVSLYFTPTQVYNKEAPEGRSFRIGGLVEEGSVKRENDGLTVNFVITDLHKSLPVVYKGILPDLFKEGKGVVAQGKMEADGLMHADEVLAKHDENYMAPEAADALKKAEVANAAAASAPASSPVAE
ncbi:MAG: cytochrome c maturation protein CcmE [Gallionella sp.]|jgi:cytochrome c-type biogenesis protein CcmE|nr:cytochrome c maturation protein CcmE [Gallionella sp.]MDP1941231.1 cytochrome c maturation protein CcmE [Gallionella sp.]